MTPDPERRGAGTRTPEHVRREYGEQKWPAMERLIEAERDAEPEAGLARILARVARAQRAAAEPASPRDFILDGETVQASPAAAYGAARGIVLDLVADACRDDTEAVVELGSGWGHSILSVWLDGGPATATYVAAEYTDAGRRAATRLAELDARIDFCAVAFDYHDPRLDDLGRSRHAVVFSTHSIEQIPEVKPALFAAIRGVAESVTCLHFEPVSWQLPGYAGNGSSERYAAEHDYNRNLLASVQAEADAGRAIVDFIHPDVFGINPQNSSTAIRWRSAPDER